jgi:hypothetical protein
MGEEAGEAVEVGEAGGLPGLRGPPAAQITRTSGSGKPLKLLA